MGQAKSTIEAAQEAGLSYRQLDWMVRTGVIRPAINAGAGTGNPMQWSERQVHVLRMLKVLREHGAQAETLTNAAFMAARLPEEAWLSRVLVTRDGRITPLLGRERHGYVVDLGECLTGQPRDADGRVPVAA